jgi:hypothetical protein
MFLNTRGLNPVAFRETTPLALKKSLPNRESALTFRMANENFSRAP